MGFGDFGKVVNNPAAELARQVHQSSQRLMICGLEMPVSYSRCLSHTQQAVDNHQPDILIGVGVASRKQIEVERIAHNAVDGSRYDVDLHRPGSLLEQGPERLRSSIDCVRLASELGADLSDDAGQYVCNAWLYGMLNKYGSTPLVGFVHIPHKGYSPIAFTCALEKIWN